MLGTLVHGRTNPKEVVTDVMRRIEALSATNRRVLAGVSATLVSEGALLGVMLPFRSHLSIATPALAFVVPVVIAVVVGGLVPGVAAAVIGILLYDVFFLPPYNKLTIREPANSLALLVYLVVVLIMAQVVDKLHTARDEARRREQDAARLFELSQALIGDLSISQLLDHIAATVQTVAQAPCTWSRNWATGSTGPPS